MIIDGEKYACEPCVRGHRVSNCQHSERHLIHIKPKGRPVSQCHHCRSMRKSRSSHVKCDCGEKTHKCMHLQTVADGHREGCCCHHGGSCSCSRKRDPPQLHPVFEAEQPGGPKPSYMTGSANPTNPSSSTVSSPRRSRASTGNSDGGLFFDANGHHGPVYKHPRLSQTSGPYQLQRGNSLPSVSNPYSNRSADNLLHGKPGLFSDDAARDLALLKSKSQDASPMLSALSIPQLDGRVPPLDLSGLKYANSNDFFANMAESELPMFSAGLSAPSVDWNQNHYKGLGGSNSPDLAPSSFDQAAPMRLPFDFNSSAEPMPNLTAAPSATSAEIDETEDLFSAYSDFQPGTFDLAATTAAMLNTPIEAFQHEDGKFVAEPQQYGHEHTSTAPPSLGSLSSFNDLQDDPQLPQWMNMSGISDAAMYWPDQMP